jgi:TolA-binding protein
LLSEIQGIKSAYCNKREIPRRKDADQEELSTAERELQGGSTQAGVRPWLRVIVHQMGPRSKAVALSSFDPTTRLSLITSFDFHFGGSPMATDQDPIFGEKQPVEFSLPTKLHVETHASNPSRSGSSSGKVLGTLLTSGLLAFLFGGAGAWGYLTCLQPMLKSEQDRSPRPSVAESATAVQSPVLSRLDELSGKLDQLQSRLDHLPKALTTADLEPLNHRLTALEDLPGKIQALDSRINPLPSKLEEDNRKITTMMADIDAVRKQVDSVQNDIATKLKADKPSAKGDTMLAQTSHERPREIEPPRNALLQPGVELFQQMKYDQASEAFDRLTRTKPDDARVWYFAALSRGLATRDWKGETEKFVTQGVEREKAGTPEKSQIDSAFADLTEETGKDWLAFYRRRAR